MKHKVENFIYKDNLNNNDALIECPISFYDSKLLKRVLNETKDSVVIYYENPILSVVRIQDTAYLELITKKYTPDLKKMRGIFGGIIRHHFESFKEPIYICMDFVNSTYKEYDYPKNFQQKSFYFIKYLYENGGAEYKSFDLSFEHDYPLAYSDDKEEFGRIIYMLKEKKYIKLNKGNIYPENNFSNINVSLDKEAHKKMESELPQFPFFKLIDEKFFTGDQRIDKRIAHAKKLFLKSDSIEFKRSACKELADVLELIKSDMGIFFSNKDVKLFFQLVNDFDIRHNNKKTNEIKYVEQFEWIFYNSLNSIITIYKLKNKSKQHYF